MSYVKKKDLARIRKEVQEYVRFQKSLAHLAKINAEIRSLLEKIRDFNCQIVDELRGR